MADRGSIKGRSGTGTSTKWNEREMWISARPASAVHGAFRWRRRFEMEMGRTDGGGRFPRDQTVERERERPREREREMWNKKEITTHTDRPPFCFRFAAESPALKWRAAFVASFNVVGLSIAFFFLFFFTEFSPVFPQSSKGVGASTRITVFY